MPYGSPTGWLARHGEVHNPSRVLYGRLPRMQLSPEGRRQAQALADFLGPRPLAAIYSSPMLRARRTAGTPAHPRERHGHPPASTWPISTTIAPIAPSITQHHSRHSSHPRHSPTFASTSLELAARVYHSAANEEASSRATFSIEPRTHPSPGGAILKESKRSAGDSSIDHNQSSRVAPGGGDVTAAHS